MLAVAGVVITQNSAMLTGDVTTFAPVPPTGSSTSPGTGTSSSSCPTYEPWCQNSVTGEGKCCRVDFECDPNIGCYDPARPHPSTNPNPNPLPPPTTCSDRSVPDPNPAPKEKKVLGTTEKEACDNAIAAANAECAKSFKQDPPLCNPPEGCHDVSSPALIQHNAISTLGGTLSGHPEPSGKKYYCTVNYTCENIRKCDSTPIEGSSSSSSLNVPI